MATITSAAFSGAANPKNKIQLSGSGFKANATTDDFQIDASVMNTENPTIVIGSELAYTITTELINSNNKDVRVRTKGSDEVWSSWVDVG